MVPDKQPTWGAARWLLLLLLPLLLTACAGTRTPSTSWPGLAADENNAYLAFGPSVIAVNLENGNQRWRYSPTEEEATTFYAQPAIDEEGTVYVGSYDGDVVALDAERGTVQWKDVVTAGRVVGGPVVAGDLLLVPSSDRQLYAVDKSNGQQVWTFSSERPIWASPRVNGEVVYLAGLDHHLYALEVESGQLIWDREFDGALADQPSSFDGALLVGTFGQSLHAVNRESGNIEWTVSTDDWVWGNPAVGEDAAYFGDVSGGFFAVDRQGRPLWQESLESGVAASPAYHDGLVYIVTEAGGVFARNAQQGDSAWPEERGIEGRLLSDPIVVNDLLLVAALDGEDLLTAFRADVGTKQWTYQLPED